MFHLASHNLDDVDFFNALEVIKKGELEIQINSLGGDFRAATDFVQKIKDGGFEEKLVLHIISASSAAAYVVFSLNCRKQMSVGGRLQIHGGWIEDEANALFDGDGLGAGLKYYSVNKNFVKKHFPERLDEFIAGNRVTISAQECLDRGIVNSIEQEL